MSDTDLSSVVRSPPPWLWRALEWLLAAVAVGGTGLALGSYLFPEMMPFAGDGSGGLLEGVATLYPVVGAGVVLLALWSLRRTGGAGWHPLRTTESETVPQPDAQTGMPERLAEATAARYRCESNEAADDIAEHLFEGAVRAVRTERGIDAERARETVRSGQWTEDPVAAAFLSAERPYPLGQQLYGRLDPGGAYQHRVRRTLDAIDATREGSR